MIEINTLLRLIEEYENKLCIQKIMDDRWISEKPFSEFDKRDSTHMLKIF